MKIAFIVDSFPKLSETFILNQIIGLLDLGHDVQIFAKSKPKEKKIHSDIERYHLIKRTHYIPKNKIVRLSKAIYLITLNFHKSPIKILKSLNIFKYKKEALSLRLFYVLTSFLESKFDIIHCRFGPNELLGVFLEEMGIYGKYITSFHGYDANKYPKIVDENVYNELFKKGNLFTTNTNFTKKQIIKLGCDKKKIVILPVGLNIKKFKFCPKKIRSSEPIKILTIGRLVEKKGHKYAIKVIAKIVKKYKNVKYIIGGDGPLRNELEDLALKLDIKDHVKFLGLIEQEEVLKLYQNTHIFLLSSVTASDGDREGRALVLQEAQAAGLPVISTLHNGIPEGVLDGKSGFLVPEKDVDALAERIEYLIKHPDLWPKIVGFGRKFVEDKYDIKKLNQKLVNIYQKLLEANSN